MWTRKWQLIPQWWTWLRLELLHPLVKIRSINYNNNWVQQATSQDSLSMRLQKLSNKKRNKDLSQVSLRWPTISLDSVICLLSISQSIIDMLDNKHLLLKTKYLKSWTNKLNKNMVFNQSDIVLIHMMELEIQIDITCINSIPNICKKWGEISWVEGILQVTKIIKFLKNHQKLLRWGNQQRLLTGDQHLTASSSTWWKLNKWRNKVVTCLCCLTLITCHKMR